jgi:hypothetical protein
MDDARYCIRNVHTLCENVVLARRKRMIIPLDYHATPFSQKVGTVENTEYLKHRIEIGIGHTVCRDKASEHPIGILYIVNVDVTPFCAIGGCHGRVSAVMERRKTRPGYGISDACSHRLRSVTQLIRCVAGEPPGFTMGVDSGGVGGIVCLVSWLYLRGVAQRGCDIGRWMEFNWAYPG